jgi:uncharacterized protein YqeY
MTAATRSGDVVRRDALRMAWSAIYAVEKRDRGTLTDEQTVAVLARELKTRRESVEAFRAGGREDLAAPEEAAIAILSVFMPQPLADAELDAFVAEAIAATGATSARDLGKVMGWLSPRTRGRADGKVVSGRVAAALARADLAAHDTAGHAHAGTARDDTHDQRTGGGGEG